jgi:hypothetical protein
MGVGHVVLSQKLSCPEQERKKIMRVFGGEGMCYESVNEDIAWLDGAVGDLSTAKC